jgi:hypothetical protein
MINEPTGSDNQVLSDKMVTLYTFQSLNYTHRTQADYHIRLVKALNIFAKLS